MDKYSSCDHKLHQKYAAATYILAILLSILYASVVVVVSVWIFTAMPVSVCPVLERLSRASRDRATPPHAAKGLIGERTGPSANLD